MPETLPCPTQLIGPKSEDRLTGVAQAVVGSGAVTPCKTAIVWPVACSGLPPNRSFAEANRSSVATVFVVGTIIVNGAELEPFGIVTVVTPALLLVLLCSATTSTSNGDPVFMAASVTVPLI